MENVRPFAFPRHMPREEAQALLAEAYQAIDEGKLLRRTNKILRKRGIDPPMHVQYVADPAVRDFADGLGITLGSDIMVYEDFPELEECVRAFEDALNELLMKRVDKAVRRWLRKNPGP